MRKGIELFRNNERNNPTPKRVAILITDGAPNQTGCDWTTIPGAATRLKNLYGEDSVELYTIGISMDMVGEENREGLKSIATGGASGDHWFEANNGAAIVDAIKQIMTSIVNEAALKNGSVSLNYTGYDHHSGTVVLTLVKAGETANINTHETTVPGKRVERYILSAEYTPDDPESIDYRTTPGGSPGLYTGNMESTNNHVVNVFQKGLKLIKVDMLTEQPIDPATFILSAPGKEDIVKTTVNSEVIIDPLEKPERKADGSFENYTLTETEAPAGYILMAETLSVNMNLSCAFKDPKTGRILTDPSGKPLENAPENELYNYVESANLMIGGTSTGFFERVSDTGTEDSETAIITYKIKNSPGVELPSTGGPGTTMMYLLGIMLTGFAGTGLVMKRKRKTA